MNNPYAFAIIAYGLLTIALCFTQAAIMGSPIGMGLAVLAAGLTYVFQSLVYVNDRVELEPLLKALWVAIVIATVGSGVTPHVLW